MQITKSNLIVHKLETKNNLTFSGLNKAEKSALSTTQEINKIDVAWGVLGALLMSIISSKSLPTIKPKILGVIMDSFLAGSVFAISSNMIRTGREARKLLKSAQVIRQK